MVISAGGNVGIGTTTPSNKLEVAGDGFLSGNLTAANLTATGTLTVTGKTTLSNASSTGSLTVGGTLYLGSALSPIYGGTGMTSYAAGDLLYADSPTTLTSLADVATGNVLLSGGVGAAPSWGKVTSSQVNFASGNVAITAASTTHLTVATAATLGYVTNSFLAVNASGQIIATSTPLLSYTETDPLAIKLGTTSVSSITALPNLTITKAQAGLGNVDNTADLAKPVSTAQQTALDGKLALTAWFATTTHASLASLPALSITRAQVTDFGGPYLTTESLYLAASSTLLRADYSALADLRDDATHRLVTDGEKASWNGKQAALATGTTAEYLRGDLSLATLDTAAVPENGNLYFTPTRVAAALAGTTTAALPDTLNRRYVTDAHLTVLGQTAGTNTGDETQTTLKTKLGAAAAGQDGYLAGTDWTTFNNKQAALGFTPENVTNKATDFSTLNDTKYPSVLATNNQINQLLAATTSLPNLSITKAQVSDLGTLVNSFNTRTGAITLTSADVTNALTFTPVNSATTSMASLASLTGLATIGSSTGQTSILGSTQLTALTVSGQTVLANASSTGSLTVGGTLYLGSALSPIYGGTGMTSYAVGDLIYADSPTTLTSLADVATGNVLLSGGVGAAPSWGKVTSSQVNFASGNVAITAASTTHLTVATAATLGYVTNSFLAVNASGQIIATTSPQAALGFTPENVTNKATDFSTLNDTKYPSVLATNNRINQLLAATTSLPNLSITKAQVSDLGTLVNSFNTRTGAITLTALDVTGALTFTPVNSATTSMASLSSLTGLATIGSSTGQTTILGKTVLTNASSSALTVTGTTYLATAGGNVGIGTTTSSTKLVVQDSQTGAVHPFLINNVAATVGSNAFYGLFQGLAPNMGNTDYAYMAFGKAASTNNRAYMSYYHAGDGSTSNRYSVGFFGGSDILNVTAAGNVGIGTTTLSNRLEVSGNTYLGGHLTATGTISSLLSTGTSTFAGGLNVYSGAFLVDRVTGITSINTLSAGALSFETDAGYVSWIDMPITSASTQNTVVGYTAQLNSNPMISVYGVVSDSSGTVGSLGVGVGTTTPAYKFQVYIDASNEGHVAATGDWARTSDTRLKKNVHTLSGALDKISRLRGVTYDWVNDIDATSSAHIGFIAQEIEEVFPEFVDAGTNGIKGVSYGAFTPVLLQAVKEQHELLLAFAGASSTWLAFPTSSDLSIDESEIDSVSEYLGDKIASGLKLAREVIARRITAAAGFFGFVRADKVHSVQGYETVDRVTGETYCIYMERGSMKNQRGRCEDITLEGTPANDSDDPGSSGEPAGGSNNDTATSTTNGSTASSTASSTEPVPSTPDSSSGTSTPASNSTASEPDPAPLNDPAPVEPPIETPASEVPAPAEPTPEASAGDSAQPVSTDSSTTAN